MAAATKQRVSAERERELLRRSSGQNLLSLKQKSAHYKKILQEESLKGLPEYIQVLYQLTDFARITSPDKRLKKKLRISEASCVSQRMAVQQHEKNIRVQENYILEREQELRDCEFCYGKRKKELAESESQMQTLVNEKNAYANLLRQDQNNAEASDFVMELESQILELKTRQRTLQREKDEFASRIVECESSITESENTLVAQEVYCAVLHKNYVRSKLEVMRLQPIVSVSKSPIETIDSLVKDSRIAEETGSIADTMSEWIFEMTSDISEVAIQAKKRQNLYKPLKEKRESSVDEISSLAEKIISERRYR